MRFLTTLIALCTLTACMSYGTKVDQEQVAQFVKGKTTYAEVIQELGKPTYSTVNSDGTRMLMYSYSQRQMNAANFIPYVGMFTGGMQSENTNVMLSFDKNSVLTDYTASEGGASMGTGVISGQKQ
jgi:outer membrane protein assembly factor BamE (lipoprotein component of BamABCDE complex)